LKNFFLIEIPRKVEYRGSFVHGIVHAEDETLAAQKIHSTIRYKIERNAMHESTGDFVLDSPDSSSKWLLRVATFVHSRPSGMDNTKTTPAQNLQKYFLLEWGIREGHYA
jgi:hypothetical protein